jgi:hypothetical protein
MDGWVYGHTLFNSSANYRSAVVHGQLAALTGDAAVEALTLISECLTPGRSAEVPFHTKKEVAATTALAMDIVDGQWTVKVRDAGPGEPDPSRAVDGGTAGHQRLPAAVDLGVRARRYAGLAVGACRGAPVGLPGHLTARCSAATRAISPAAPRALVSGSSE